MHTLRVQFFIMPRLNRSLSILRIGFQRLLTFVEGGEIEGKRAFFFEDPFRIFRNCVSKEMRERSRKRVDRRIDNENEVSVVVGC